MEAKGTGAKGTGAKGTEAKGFAQHVTCRMNLYAQIRRISASHKRLKVLL
jgi:hypothetical protein